MKVKKIIVGILMAAMVVSLAGCGKEEKKETASQKKASSQNAAANNLKDAYKNDFSIGVAINTYQLQDEDILALVKENFNSITM